MTDSLFEIPETVPLWVTLKEKHGIETHCAINTEEPHEWTAKLQSRYSYAKGETEREAVVTLIHSLKLKGWESVSVNP